MTQAPKRLTPERETDIKEFLNIKTEVMHLSKLSQQLRDSLADTMSELDALRADCEYLYKRLEEEKDNVDRLKAENEKLLNDEHSAVQRGNRLAQENNTLSARVKKLRDVLSLYILGDENGALDDAGEMGREALAQDDQEGQDATR